MEGWPLISRFLTLGNLSLERKAGKKQWRSARCGGDSRAIFRVFKHQIRLNLEYLNSLTGKAGATPAFPARQAVV